MDELGKAGELIRTVSTKITSTLTSTLDQCEQCLSTCQSNIEGHGHDTMAAIQQKLDKINKKIDDYLITKIATCYNLLAQFGVKFPTDEELHQGPGAEGRPSQGSGGQQTQQQYPGPLEGLPAKPIKPLTHHESELKRPYPEKPKKPDDCCLWWILWWEWFQPQFWHWFNGWLHGDCLPVALCSSGPDDTPQISGPAEMPIYPLNGIPETETGVADEVLLD